MNWARDNTQLSEADLNSVFRYDPKGSTVIRILASHDWQAKISSKEGNKEWSQFIENDLPSIDRNDSGLILLLAKRSGEPTLTGINNASSKDWMERANKESQLISGLERSDTFFPLQEKEVKVSNSSIRQLPSGRRGVRTVPFSKETFEQITCSFYTHSSIARVVSRSDVPVFTCDVVNMTEPAYVYNCRSSNAWEMDLALTVTHFPKKNLTFAILFGCSFLIEKEIVKRLEYMQAEVAHPLLMPGIFAEIEKRRHNSLVEEMGNTLETLVFQLDHQSNDFEGPQGALAETRSKDKRTAYLDLSYLRNSLVTSKTQLAKMIQHCRQLKKEQYSSKSVGNSVLHQDNDIRVGRTIDRVASRSSNDSRSPSRDEWYEIEASDESDALISKERAQVEKQTRQTDPQKTYRYLGRSREESVELADMQITSRQSTMMNEVTSQPVVQSRTRSENPEEWEDLHEKLRDTCSKIESRLMSIRDEYDDKIRDCTMRVDGMAMSTQWSHGETNVEIALATNRDSRHMRSIALVTMIFLPGTFFASMFSMTFFNWSNDPGSPTVSMYLWIYIVMTVLFTSLTVGLWYYIVVFRPSRGKVKDDEQGLMGAVMASR